MKRPALSLVASLLMLCSVYPVMAQERYVDEIVIQNNRSISTETIKLYIQTKKGDIYNKEKVQRDFQAVLAQGFFDEFESQVFEKESRPGRVTIIFFLKERPLIYDILYEGLKSFQESEVLQRFREKRVGISKGSRYDPLALENAKRVLKELLAEKGKPNAQIECKPDPISTNAVTILFSINEGRRVRVARIDFDGNKAFSDRRLRKSMKLVKQTGLFTSITSKDIYDGRKLEDDLQRVRLFIGENGHLRPRIGEPVVEPTGEIRAIIPLIGPKSDGVNIRIPIDEGRCYSFGKIKVEGNTLFNEDNLIATSGLKTGEVASLKEISEGVFQRIRKLYGNSGYIQATTELKPEFNEPAGTVDLTIKVEEGKSFTIRRINFTGNTITRDQVLRREFLIDEGELYRQDFIDLSILRINQLGFFDEVKENDLQMLTDEQKGDVYLTLKVKEKGRQKVSLSGGGGAGGSFIGISYSTNNLLGYGESLSLDLQLGNRQQGITASFTEPYLLGRPVSAGISVFANNIKFLSDGLSAGFLSNTASGGSSSSRFDSSLFTRSSVGFTLNLSAPLTLLTEKRYLKYARFARTGLSYSYSSTKITDPEVNRDNDPGNDIAISFRQPDIKISTITPSIIYNTLNNPVDPTKGKSLSATLSLSGLGGDVKLINPSMEVKYFSPIVKRDKPQVLGMRFLAEHVSSFGSSPATNSLAFVGGVPVFNRFFLGGEDSIRGFNTRSISPVAQVEQFITTNNVQAIDSLRGRVLPVLRPGRRFRGIDKRVLDKFTFNNAPIGNPAFSAFTPIGADTKLLYNIEYRIPIAGPLSMALFADAGTAFNTASLNNQTLVSNPIFRGLSRDPNLTALGVGSTVILNSLGRIASPEEIRDARTPELGNQLPKGFRLASLQGNFISTSLVRLSEDVDGLRENFRSSLGGELRLQVPVVNLPVRFIFAYNPNARTSRDRSDPREIFIERKTTFSFSIGRTF
jgi:outer membrane protein insertion porin family